MARFDDRTRGNVKKSSEAEVRINNKITAREVRLIGAEGEQLGVMNFREAMYMAEDLMLDLVEISPNTNPPVCKIMNYSKFCYEKTKKEKLNRKQSKAVKIKEVTIKPAIEAHDYNHKCQQARGFLEKGDKVKVTLKMRGREIQHATENVELLKKFVADLADCSKTEQPVKQERTMATVILQSLTAPVAKV